MQAPCFRWARSTGREVCPGITTRTMSPASRKTFWSISWHESHRAPRLHGDGPASPATRPGYQGNLVIQVDDHAHRPFLVLQRCQDRMDVCATSEISPHVRLPTGVG